jgi:hypothetical protein
MGRPIQKKFFGNTNVPPIGGEGVASVTNPAGTLADLETGTFTIPAGSISAPQLAGGEKPVLQVVVTGATAYTVTVVSAGSGYTSAPTITFNGSITGGTASGSATPIATLTATKQNAISVSAYVTGGSAKAGDIVRQTGSRRYRVTTADGTENLVLVAAAPAAGEMTMTAEDSAGGTYYVTKLTAHRAVIVKGDRTGTQFTTGTAGISVPWTFDTPTASVSVKILNA